MNTEQLEYEQTFYTFFENGRDVLDWSDDEFNEAVLERAKSMRSNVELLDERFNKDEWLQILNKIITASQ